MQYKTAIWEIAGDHGQNFVEPDMIRQAVMLFRRRQTLDFRSDGDSF